MEILTPQGVARTNGEVLSLIRRRRDERSSKQLPPFAMQVGIASGYPFLSVTSSFIPSSAMFQISRQQQQLKKEQQQKEGGGLLQDQLIQTSAPQITVLLTEVLVLQYLTHQADLCSKPAPPPPSTQDTPSAATPSPAPAVRSCEMGDLYGPGSVFDPLCFHHHHDYAKALEVRQEMEDSAAPPKQLAGAALSEEREVYLRQLLECHQLLESTPASLGSRHGHRAGEVGAAPATGYQVLFNPDHVFAVDALLRLYEGHGRAQERRWAAAIRKLVQRIFFHLAASATGAGSATTVPHHPTEATHFLSPPTPLHQAVSLLHAAVLPLPTRGHQLAAVAAAEEAEDDEEAEDTKSAPPPPLLLTSLEVLQLVNGRPHTSVDVFRLLDDLSVRFQRWRRRVIALGLDALPTDLRAAATAAQQQQQSVSSEVPEDVDAFAAAVVRIFTPVGA